MPLTSRTACLGALFMALVGLLVAVLMIATRARPAPVNVPEGAGDAVRAGSPESKQALHRPIRPQPFTEEDETIVEQVGTRPVTSQPAVDDADTTRFLTELEAYDNATKDIEETYGIAHPDEERFFAQPLQAYLWQLNPEYHVDAITSHLEGDYISRLQIVRGDPGANKELDQAIHDLTEAWVIYARLRARLTWVEARLAITPSGSERQRLQKLQNDLQTYTVNGFHNCNRIATRFAERFAMIEPYVSNRTKRRR